MNYELLEKELKKRLKFDYNWGRKQTNKLDVETNFIYKINTFDAVLSEIETSFKNSLNFTELKNYALNRWFNFWSAKGVEAIFCEHENVHPHQNSKDKYTDFFVNSIPFDHKTTVFPAGFKKSIPYAIEHKRELIAWLYKNQSQQQRKHLKNRLFIVLIDFNEQNEHWKLKAEILWLQKIISTYLSTFTEDKLETFYFQNNIVKSDIIWAIK
ncbi:hypothetical protein [Lutibacter maritimus]|uniref:Uncharacterized protein n=1 Tax=Lutibacter maritimus TaxID=593133 RepID=A0A1I6Q9W1_9FLAO|nr:hypothetical protein [Lutibacter maritimus]SFS49261.1 hypothetical protein SAMN04488006_1671 [Lutibacter maritimus]